MISAAINIGNPHGGVIVLARFHCLMCGDCCRGFTRMDSPIVLPWEKRVLEREARRRGLPEQAFEPILAMCRGDDCVVLLYRWVIEGDCPFLSGDHCGIYRDRPLSCRMFPLILGLTDRTIRVSARCRWVGENRWVIHRRVDPHRVFPEETMAAIKVFSVLNQAINTLRGQGYAETPVNELRGKKLRDYAPGSP